MPHTRLKKLTRLLGWQTPLELHQHCSDPKSKDTVITWYESGISTGGRQDLFLQINEHPQGQTKTYVAAVFAIRYRICTGWHAFDLPDDDKRLEALANRLSPILSWHWFDTLDRRREFRRLHPEMTGHSWRTIGESGGLEMESNPR